MFILLKAIIKNKQMKSFNLDRLLLTVKSWNAKYIRYKAGET